MTGNLVEELRATFKSKSLQQQIFDILSDRKWHCRVCEGKKVNTAQYAGGGGIQGLQRGTKKRPGLVIKSEMRHCKICQVKTRHDRWTGRLQQSNAATNIPKKLAKKILNFYDYRDVIEQRKRAEHELVIDHKFPMERWGAPEDNLSSEMSDDEIKSKFQLLKKDSSGNHNLLKSRSCERCIKTEKRGQPFGIAFWYQGGENWVSPHQRGSEAEKGCVGCGWYDFEAWRKALNTHLNNARASREINSDSNSNG
ncbi:restriction endonuclease [Geitlerinema sp. CS-897]|nr:restriction endonuclease [Geitlerinema sp. CS-897]